MNKISISLFITAIITFIICLIALINRVNYYSKSQVREIIVDYLLFTHKESKPVDENHE